MAVLGSKLVPGVRNDPPSRSAGLQVMVSAVGRQQVIVWISGRLRQAERCSQVNRQDSLDTDIAMQRVIGFEYSQLGAKLVAL